MGSYWEAPGLSGSCIYFTEVTFRNMYILFRKGFTEVTFRNKVGLRQGFTEVKRKLGILGLLKLRLGIG